MKLGQTCPRDGVFLQPIQQQGAGVDWKGEDLRSNGDSAWQVRRRESGGCARQESAAWRESTQDKEGGEEGRGGRTVGRIRGRRPTVCVEVLRG